MKRKRKNKQPFTDDSYESQLIQRIDECQTVINHINECPAFMVIVNDCKREIGIIDSKWHTLPNCADYVNKLQELRITKMAYEHLINLKSKYDEELDNDQQELNKLQNISTEITKDFDNE